MSLQECTVAASPMNAALLLLILPSLGYSRVIPDDPEYLLVEPPKCPLDAGNPKCGPVREKDQCKTDADCEGGRKCCTSGCRKLCLMTLKVKQGSCPTYEPILCDSEPPTPNECYEDDHCPGSLKCCYQCRLQCMLTLPFQPTQDFE